MTLLTDFVVVNESRVCRMSKSSLFEQSDTACVSSCQKHMSILLFTKSDAHHNAKADIDIQERNITDRGLW